MEQMSALEYQSKKEEVLNRFKKEWTYEKLHTDPMFRSIVEMLIRDTNPYAIIERLLEDRSVLIENIKGYVNMHSFPKINTPTSPS